MIREYIYLNGEPLAQVNAGSPETVTYLHTDHLGTPKFGTNAAGAQVWAWAPDSFGNGTPTGSATVNLRMPGQYFDAESGIFYNWNRYYNPEIGRYISSDPIGLEGGMNTFLYAGANPVMAVDPEGLAAAEAAAVVACLSNPVCAAVVGTATAATGATLACQATPGCVEALKHGANAIGGGLQTLADGVRDGVLGCLQYYDPYNMSVLQNSTGGDPSTQDLQKISSNKGADKAAQEQGYKDAHDAKAGRGDSKVNI